MAHDAAPKLRSADQQVGFAACSADMLAVAWVCCAIVPALLHAVPAVRPASVSSSMSHMQ